MCEHVWTDWMVNTVNPNAAQIRICLVCGHTEAR